MPWAADRGPGGQGGLLNPVNKLVGGVTGGVLSGPYKPVLEPALANTGKAADNLLPLGLGPTLGGVGAALDPTVGPLAGTVTNLTQQVGATTAGAPVAGLLNNVGGTVAGLGGQVGNTAGLGGVLQAGRHRQQRGRPAQRHAGNTNPLGNTLAATGTVAALTGGLAWAARPAATADC